MTSAFVWDGETFEAELLLGIHLPASGSAKSALALVARFRHKVATEALPDWRSMQQEVV